MSRGDTARALDGVTPVREDDAWQLRVAAVVTLAVLLSVLYVLADGRYRVAVPAMVSPDALIACYGAVFAAGVGSALFPSRRRLVLLLAACPAYVFVLGVWSLALFGYCGLVCVLARSRLMLRYQLALGLGAWAILPATRGELWPAAWRSETFLLAVVWAQLAYATLYLLVERARWDDEPTVVDDLVYLVALPRLAEPFFQPISPRHLFGQEIGRLELRRMAKGFGLGLFGALLSVSSMWLRSLHASRWPAPLHTAHSIAILYAFSAGQLFVSVSLFRLLGFDIASGFRRPFLSRSFRDWFRRWNHYVRDAVVELFLFPLQGYLRKRLPKTAARIVASYLAILLGSFLMNDLLIPAATSFDLLEGARRSATIRRMLVFVVYWSAIILPAAGLEVTARQAQATRARRAFEVARFLLLFGFLWTAARYLETAFLR